MITKASDDETFLVGDHIKLNTDLTISCIEAKGWIEAADVDKATKGMEVEIDKDYIARCKKKLEALCSM